MANIYKYSVHIKGDMPVVSTFDRDEFKKQTFEVLLENDDYIVISDFRFTSLRKGGRDKEINIPIIFEMKFGKYNDGIYYHYYCYGNRKPETIKSDLKEWIEKKYGYLLNINLDFIK